MKKIIGRVNCMKLEEVRAKQGDVDRLNAEGADPAESFVEDAALTP